MTQTPPGPAADVTAGARHRAPLVCRRVLRTWLIVGVAVVGFAFLALIAAAYFGTAYGAHAAFVALVAAALPLGIVVPSFLWLDRFEAEPVPMLVLAFLWGALVAAGIAAIANTSILQVLQAGAGVDAATLTTAVVVAPLVEEAAKAGIVLLLWWFARREFNGVVDGLVYAGISAAGFAFTENIQYLATAYADGGTSALTATLVGRGVMSPFAHPMFTALTGVGIGVASVSRRGSVRVGAPLAGYVLAVLAHALWNLAAFTAGQGMFTIYFLIEVPIFIAFVVLVVLARRWEGQLIGQYLRPYADVGWLAPAEVGMLASMGRRRDARSWARLNGGAGGLAAMREFQDAASELAFLRRRMTLNPPGPDDLAEQEDLLLLLAAERRRFVGTGYR